MSFIWMGAASALAVGEDLHATLFIRRMIATNTVVSWRCRLCPYLFLALLAPLIMLPILQDNTQPHLRDSGMFFYAGWRILEGDTPYTDFWDHKPPVIFYINALGLLLARASRFGVHLLETLSLAVSSMLGFALLHRRVGRFPALVALVIFNITLVLLLMGGNFTEEYALPAVFLALFVASDRGGQGSTRTPRFHMIIGATAAVTFLLRPNLIAPWIAIGLYTLLDARVGPWSERVGSLAKMGLWFAIAALLILLPTLLSAGPRPFIEAVLLYNISYSTAAWSDRLSAIYSGFQHLAQSYLAYFGLLGGIAAIYDIRKSDIREADPLLLLVLPALLIEMFMSSLSGRSYLHYYISWLPYFTILGGLFLALLLRQVRMLSRRWLSSRRGRTAIVGLAGVAIIIASAMTPAKVWYRQLRHATQENVPYANLLAFVQARTSAREKVLTWGAEAGVNFDLQRAAPSLYVYQYPAFDTASPYFRRDTRRLLADLRAAPPALIVDTSASNTRVPPLDAQQREAWLQMIVTGNWPIPELEHLQPLFAFVHRNYTVVDDAFYADWTLYELHP